VALDVSESELVSKGPCESCGSSDANCTYTDGHQYCFRCGVWKPGDETPDTPAKVRRVSGLITGEVRGLRTRKITDETARHFGYMMGTYKGKAAQIAPYYSTEGVLVAQHLRQEGKEFPWLGSPKEAAPFGYHAFPKSGKMLVLTEGEIDAMSFSQVQGNKWPVWSIGSGAGPQTRKWIAERRDLFMAFEKVVLMFDNDGPGREAAQAAAEVIGPRAHIAELPLKDANDMLVAGRTEEMVNAMWRAKPYRPEGLVELSTLKEKVFSRAVQGAPWFLEEMNALTYGRRTGEIYIFGAGTGVGKTDFLMEQVKFDIMDLGLDVGVFFFEQAPEESAIRLLGKVGSRPFHIPDAGWSEQDKEAAWEGYSTAKGKVYAYDSFGVNDWDVIKERIRYLYHSEGVRHYYIDHLTALAAWQDDERKALELIMSDIGGLVKELDIAVYLISHLATPEGKPHEEGGRVMIRHFKGSRAIGFWAHFMFGMERNQQDEDPLMRITTTIRCLKDRYTGRGTGATFYVRYDQETGRLNPVDIGQDSTENNVRASLADSKDTPQLQGDGDDL
jgi:DNA helicase/primase-like protein/Toprim domain-containing protein/DnaB helicase-like protein